MSGHTTRDATACSIVSIVVTPPEMLQHVVVSLVVTPPDVCISVLVLRGRVAVCVTQPEIIEGAAMFVGDSLRDCHVTRRHNQKNRSR